VNPKTWFLLLAAGCANNLSDKVIDGPVLDDTDAVPPSPCAGEAEVSFVTPAAPLADRVSLTVTLTHPDAEPADLTLQYAIDGELFRTPTILGELTGLASGPDGVEHLLDWDTVPDLGYTETSVTLQIIASSASCAPWPLAERELVINNEDTPVPTCEIALAAAETPIDGDARLDLTLRHDAAVQTSVAVSWSDDGVEWAPARLKLVDCDGDAAVDDGVDVPVSATAATRCVTWDSQADLAADTTVSLRAACLVQGLQEAEVTLAAVEVRNDPTPDPGELVISELMPVPAAPDGHYIELQNVSGHILDVEGLWVGRWRQVTPLTSPPDREFTVSSETGVLAVPPGGQVLLGKSDDDAASGCRPVDEVWPSTFSLSFDSTLVLRHHDVEIAALPFFQSTGWSFSEGVALGLDLSTIGTPSSTSRNGWCLQTSAVPGCAAVPTTGEVGTPGSVNDPC
jgi:hypothetical protein